MAPRLPNTVPRRPKLAPTWHQNLPKAMVYLWFLLICARKLLSFLMQLSSRLSYTKMAPRGAQDGPRSPQDGPRRPQDDPKTAQDSPKMAQDGPKTVPKRLQNGPRCPKTFRRRSQDGLKHDRKPQNLEERSAAGITPQGSQSGRPSASAERRGRVRSK